jgi:2-oxoisovalerate dehydrogenase E1 component alpha subunit
MDVDPNVLLPPAEPISFLSPSGELSPDTPHLGISDEQLVGMYRDMVRLRTLDMTSVALQRQGQLGVWASCRGQEGAQVGCGTALSEGDWVFPAYRDHGVTMVRGVPFESVLKQYKGVWHGCYDPYEYQVASHSIPISTQLLHATGFATAAKFNGELTAVITFTGEGGTSEGDFHEAVNFAAVYGAPVVFFIQNNQYAISVPREDQNAAPTIAHKGVGYGAKGFLVDGNDIIATHHVTKLALERARSGRGPSIIEAITYRMQPHTTADDDTRYRPPDELDEWQAKDPIARLERYLLDQGALYDEDIARIAAEADEESVAIRTEVVATGPADMSEVFANVYVDPPADLVAQAAEWTAGGDA